MTVMQGPPTEPTQHRTLDSAIAAHVNIDNPWAFLTRLRERFQSAGEYDQDHFVTISYDDLIDLVTIAELAYAWNARG